MAAVMIDTAEFVEELEKEGIEHKQARAFVNVLRRSQEVVLAGQIKALEEVSVRTAKELDSKTEKALIAFQHDVNRRFAEIEQRFTESKNDIEQRFTESRNDIELRFAESRNDIELRFAESKNEMDRRFAESKNNMDQRFAENKNEMNQRFAEVGTRFTEIKGELTLLKWMLGVLITGVAGLIVRAFFMP